MADKADGVEQQVSEYRKQLPYYEECTNRLRDLLKQMLDGAALGARIHSVTCRRKDIDSLREKLVEGDGKYSELASVTDLVGLRVITYFGEDVDEVANIIEAELKIDKANSIDKRQTLDPDRFGYLSLHYVCKLDDGRAKRLENVSLADLPFEIQIRSILQHAWAEIEHDLGYKTVAGVPADMRRRFSRLAGLLEIADDEFQRLRADLEAYANTVGAEITKDPSAVQIDKDSIAAFVAQSEQVKQLDAQIVGYGEGELEAEISQLYMGTLPVWLTYVGLQTIQDVRQSLQDEAELMLKHCQRHAAWVRRRRTEPPLRPVRRGRALFRLGLLLLAKSGDPSRIIEGFSKAGYEVGVPPITDEDYARSAVAIWQELESAK